MVVPAEHLEALLTKTDSLRVVVRAHQGVESMLNLMLLDQLPNAEGGEVERLRFSLKAELLASMGHLRKADLPVFEKLDRIRNRFAHKPEAAIAASDATELKGCLSDVQRSMYGVGEFSEERPETTLVAVALILHSQLWKTIEHNRDSATAMEYGMNELRQTLERSRRKEPHPPRAETRDTESAALVAAERKKRNELGEP